MVFVGALLSILITLLLVVGLHEAGHAVVASFFKVKIQRISIGFGKPLFCWQDQKGVEWVWAIWPLGGYVLLLNSRIKSVPASAHVFCFDKKPVWIRCLILLAGAVVNVVIGWLALVCVFLLGYQQVVPVVKTVVAPSIASTAGLASGDQILSIAGHAVTSWQDVGMQLLMRMDQPTSAVEVETAAGGARHLKLNLGISKLQKSPSSLLEAVGITPDLALKNKHDVAGLPLLEAAQQAGLQMIHMIYFYLVMIKQFVMGVIPFSVLLGPLGMFTTMIGSFFQGLTVFLYFIASFSFAVGLVNLLPIPGLDGGSILYTLVEKIRGKPVSVAMEILIQQLVSIWFCLILIQLILNDVRRYYG